MIDSPFNLLIEGKFGPQNPLQFCGVPTNSQILADNWCA